MIENYLDFVKAQRRTSLRLARRSLQMERADYSDLAKGIDAGLRIAYDIESRAWRTLQKDIEARIADGKEIAIVDPLEDYWSQRLAQRGGKNG